MRKEYDFSRAVLFKEWRRRRRQQRPLSDSEADGEVAPLSRSQIRELDRRVKDSKDRMRYLLVSVMGSRFVLYYNVSQDAYGMNNPRYATLFKRRAAAEAIRAQLGGSVQLVRCRVDSRDRLILASLPTLRAKWPKPRTRRRLTRA